MPIAKLEYLLHYSPGGSRKRAPIALDIFYARLGLRIGYLLIVAVRLKNESIFEMCWTLWWNRNIEEAMDVSNSSDGNAFGKKCTIAVINCNEESSVRSDLGTNSKIAEQLIGGRQIGIVYKWLRAMSW